VANQVAERSGAYVLPILKYGNCSSTKNFPGTITLRFETLTMIVEDIVCELARTGFRNVVILSGHAGRAHMTALKQACARVLEKHDLKLMVLSDYDIAYTMDEIGIPVNDGHAGMIETSRIMALRPELVKGTAEPHHPNFPEFRVLKHPEKHFPSGVMGEPQLATKEFGENANKVIVVKLTELIQKMVDSEE
jgi:creatinine amidohydrolase